MYRTGDDLNGDDLGLNDRSIHISFSHEMANSVSLYRKAEQDLGNATEYLYVKIWSSNSFKYRDLERVVSVIEF